MDSRWKGFLPKMLSHFMHLRPDQQGMSWRTPQSHRSEAGAASGWAQINVLIDDEVAGRLAGLAMELNISRATLAYTALYWLCATCVRLWALRPHHRPPQERAMSEQFSLLALDSLQPDPINHGGRWKAKTTA